MITATQVQNLINLGNKDHLISSLYLRLWPDSKNHRLKAKDLVRGKRDGLDTLSKQDRRFVETDFERLQDFVGSLHAPPYQGLVIFSSASQKIWEVFLLPQPVRDLLVLDSSAHVRPLVRMLEEHGRICTLLVGSTRARIFEIFMAEIEEQSEILSDVPPKVRDEGWSGYSARKIERHVEYHLHTHLKRVAEKVFDHFRERAFDCLLMGGSAEVATEMEATLHSYLRERLKRTFRMDMDSRPKQVLDKTLELAGEIKKEEDLSLVLRLVNSLKPSGLGITGIDETLASLYEGSVHTLLVEEDYSQKGVTCSKCGFMGLNAGSCPICGETMKPVPDIVDEAVAKAIDQNSEVYHITSGCGLKEVGGIGALLRYPTVKH